MECPNRTQLDVLFHQNKNLFIEHQILPINIHNGYLQFLTPKKISNHALREIEFYTDLIAAPIDISPEEFEKQTLIQQHQNTMQAFLENLPTPNTELDGFTFENDVPLIKFIDNLLQNALEENISDIHLEPYEKFFRIRARCAGQLFEKYRLPTNVASFITQRLKILAHLDITELYQPQEGKFDWQSKTIKAEIRVSLCPTLYGEKIALRLLKKTQTPFSLSSLGLIPEQIEILLNHLSKKTGFILVTGPTGSGKSRTLYSLLHLLNEEGRNILTIEDPVEMVIEGINQVSFEPKRKQTPSDFLKAFLRQDPDVIMIGEIRDATTADLAFKAAQSGHFVLSTLHTPNAARTPERLKNLGIETYRIKNNLSLVLAQRLLRLSPQSTVASVAKQIAIFELLALSPQTHLKNLQSCISPSMKDVGHKLVDEGLTSLMELNRAL
jgi:type IV pilus assembly protein PilB